MNKKLFLFVAAMTAFSALPLNMNAQSQTSGKTAKVYCFDDEEWFGGQFLGVSPNGKYAVGKSPEGSQTGFIWYRETGEIKKLGGSLEDKSEAYAVSDNGVVVGTFLDEKSLSGSGRPAFIPGFWKDGVWTALPLLQPLAGLDLNGWASAVSADGRVILGTILRSYGKYSPVIWIDGVLQPLMEETIPGQGGLAMCMSQDYKMIGGAAEHEEGARSPAIWTDEVLERLDGKEFPLKGDEEGWFYMGQTQSISPNGKYATGMFDLQGDGMNSKPFIWTKEEGIHYFSENGLGSFVTDEGVVYGCDGFMGNAFIYKNSEMIDLFNYIEDMGYEFEEDAVRKMSAPMGVSKDEKVIAGWSGVVLAGPTMVPVLIVLEEPSSIEKAESNELKVYPSVVKDHFFVKGDYNNVEVFNTVGTQIAVNSQANGVVYLGEQQNGVYFVKVDNGGQISTFKISVRR